jgi:hypothetical protein
MASAMAYASGTNTRSYSVIYPIGNLLGRFLVALSVVDEHRDAVVKLFIV